MKSTVGLSLKRNFIWTLGGNVIYAGSQWAMLVVLAKLGNPSAVGRLALGLAVTAPVFMFAQLQLRSVQVTDAKREYAFADYLALRLVTMLLAMLALIGILAASGYKAEVAMVIFAIGAAKMIEGTSDVFYGFMQQHERMDRIAISMTIKGLLSLAAFGIAYLLTHSVLWCSIALVGAWSVVMLFYDVRSGRMLMRLLREVDGTYQERLWPRWRWKQLWNLGMLSLPLGFVMMLISLNTNVPRYFIERQLGERELGVFAAITALMVAINTIVCALGQSASPRMAKHYAAGDRRAYGVLVAKLVMVGILLGVTGVGVVLIGGRWILTLLYGPEYASHTVVFALVAVASGIACVQSFLGYAVTAARYFNIQAPLLALVTAVTAGSCFLLIPAYGLAGAAVALMISSAVHVLGNVVILAHAMTRASKRSI
ncbi:MAG: oligosaccharide flippase family protein [Armatimonadota bacterium]